jgi:hypothetical protein
MQRADKLQRLEVEDDLVELSERLSTWSMSKRMTWYYFSIHMNYSHADPLVTVPASSVHCA